MALEVAAPPVQVARPVALPAQVTRRATAAICLSYAAVRIRSAARTAMTSTATGVAIAALAVSNPCRAVSFAWFRAQYPYAWCGHAKCDGKSPMPGRTPATEVWIAVPGSALRPRVAMASPSLAAATRRRGGRCVDHHAMVTDAPKARTRLESRCTAVGGTFSPSACSVTGATPSCRRRQCTVQHDLFVEEAGFPTPCNGIEFAP